MRTIDISGLVRLRKHLSWSSNAMGALGSCAIVVAIDMPELRDAVYIGADGVLAMVTFLVLFKGLVAAIAPLAIGLAPYFRAGRSSPYLKLMFASNRTLGADYAGGALSWKDWFSSTAALGRRHRRTDVRRQHHRDDGGKESAWKRPERRKSNPGFSLRSGRRALRVDETQVGAWRHCHAAD